MRLDRLPRRLLAALFAAFAGAAAAGQPPGPLIDPWVPPQVRAKVLAPPAQTAGEALAAQVEAKLRRRFEAAAGPGGALTREQARAAGLGHVARHFEAIDRRGAGAVTFDDYREYLRR